MSGVSILILTFNEEVNLGPCLKSVRWSDDIYVVDSGSTDRTQTLAREAGAHVHVHPFENFSAQRNWALRNVPFRYEWLLVLDADERVPPDLAQEIRAAVAQAPPGVAGFAMRLRVYFLGRWLKHAGQFGVFWYLRLFRHASTRYEDRQVNAYPLVNGEVKRLQGALHHENRKSVHDLIEKYIHYATFEAEETLRLLRGEAPAGVGPRIAGSPEQRRRWLKQLHLKLPLRGTRKLLYLLFWRRGLLDGIPGLLFCWYLASLEQMISLQVGAFRRGLPVRP